jgi:hypothetical protein
MEHYPHLHICHRIDVRNDPEVAHTAARECIESRGAPNGIYSVAGGNSGVRRALEELELARHVLFVGHELNANSRRLLQSGVMNYLIGRDQEREVMLSLAMLEAVMEGRPHHDRDTPHVRIISRFTCVALLVATCRKCHLRLRSRCRFRRSRLVMVTPVSERPTPEGATNLFGRAAKADPS